MTTCSLVLCLAALLTFCTYSCNAGSINCRKFVYHPRCRGVAAKRAELTALPVIAHRRTSGGGEDSDRKGEEEVAEPVQEFIPVDISDSLPRRAALWSYLADRSGNILLAHRKLDPDTLDINYPLDYE